MKVIRVDDMCPNFFVGVECDCAFCSNHEPCDECNGFRHPEELHEEQCSLAGELVLQIEVSGIEKLLNEQE